MTFEHPLALVLLVAVPLAWWLSRNRSGAPVVRVASLLAFAGAAATTPSAAPRRAIDWRLVLVLAAMTLLSLGAAGPTFGATRPAAFYLVIDDSASMSRFAYVQPTLAARADSVLNDVAPGSLHERRRQLLRKFDWGFGAFHTGPTPPVDSFWTPESDGLPQSIAPHLDAARAEGFPGVVLVTDADIEAMPGVALIGPTVAAKWNVAVTSAALDGDEAIVTVRNYGAKDVAVRVVCADVAREIAVAARGVGTARFAAADRGEMATFEIASPADDLAADDRLVVARRGGARRVGGDVGREAHLLAALRSAGAQVDVQGASDAVVQFGGGVSPPGREPLLVVSPRNPTVLSREPPRIRLVLQTGLDTVRGDEIVGRGTFADVLPSPATTLVASGRLTGGEPIWSDAHGALAARDGDLVVVALDPEDPRSDWHRDPSFPAFIAAALDQLTGGPDRLVALGAVPPSESDIVRDPPRTSSPDEIRAVMRPVGYEPDAVRPARWLALAAVVLLAATALVRRP